MIHHGVMPLSTWFGVKFTPGNPVHLYLYSFRMLFDIPEDILRYYTRPMCMTQRRSQLQSNNSYIIYFFFFRWSQYFLWNVEYICAYYYVFILHVGRIWTWNAEIPLVEEVPHSSPDGRLLYLYQFHSIDHQLRLKCAGLYSRTPAACKFVFLMLLFTQEQWRRGLS